MADAMAAITIKMPKDWADHFWGWWLDGGGEQMFLEDVDKTECEGGYTWSDWDREQRLIVHAKDQAALRGAMLSPPAELEEP
jgi:hypothetical protein